MYDTILFPTDGSDHAESVLEHALQIASDHDATIHILNIADTGRDSVSNIRGTVIDVLEETGQRIVGEAGERATERGVSVVTEFAQGEPYRGIVEYAEARGIDVIVMPTHGRRGLERFLLGSTTERVVRQAHVPVLTIRPAEDATLTYPYRNVLVPTDGSECADRALAMGVDLARMEGAAIHFLSVVAIASLGVDVRPDLQIEPLTNQANEIIENAETVATDAGVDSVSGTVKYGPSIHQAILSYIDEHDVDLVVVGTHGRTGFDRYVLGSVTEYLIRTSPIPVLTVSDPIQET